MNEKLARIISNLLVYTVAGIFYLIIGIAFCSEKIKLCYYKINKIPYIEQRDKFIKVYMRIDR